LRELAEQRDMAHVQRRVDGELGVEAAHAILLGADGHVVPGAEVLDVRPGRPARRVDALLAGALQLLGGGLELLPRLWRLRLEAGLPESIAIDVEHDRRAVERE